MEQLELIEFAHSHYCEIVRWALDHKGLTYSSRTPLPGYHAIVAKRYAPESSLPILRHGQTAIQGSSKILDYLETTFSEKPLSANVGVSVLRKTEQDLGEAIGDPLRQFCYSYLLAEPKLVRFLFMHRSGFLANQAFRAIYPVLRKKIHEAYDCTPTGRKDAEQKLVAAFDQYDERLANNRYLCADAFTRADIALGSLLAFAVLPEQYPVPWPDELRNSQPVQWFTQFRDRPTLQHVIRLYKNHR